MPRKATSSTSENLMPFNLEAERAVLGSILLGDEESFTVLKPSDFYRSQHGEIFAACLCLYEEGKPIDLITLSEALGDKLQNCGGVSYISSLIETVPTASNGKHWAEIVKEKAEKREIGTKAYQIYQKCLNDEPLNEILRSFDEVYTSPKEGIYALKDCANDVFEQIKKTCEQKRPFSGLPTGFSYLDHLLNGFQGGDLIVIGARPSTGKTALALNFAVSIAQKGYPVGFFSLEMSISQLVIRILALLSKIEGNFIRSGRLEEKEIERLMNSMAKLQDLPIYLNELTGLNCTELRFIAKKMRSKWNVQAFFIDYLQLISPPRVENRNQEIEEITRRIKLLARELNVPFILLSQLNRKLEERQDKRPVLSDLRDSGAIEQAADVVGFLYPKGQEEVDLIIAKHRNGPIGEVPLRFKKEFSLFEEVFV